MVLMAYFNERRFTSFNGAAGVGPRMAPSMHTTKYPDPASMGPRGLARGWENAMIFFSFGKVASMGPRGLARGWGELTVNATPCVALQWGRGGWPADGRFLTSDAALVK